MFPNPFEAILDPRTAAEYELEHARGGAISQYAHLETVLCDLFSIGFREQPIVPKKEIDYQEHLHLVQLGNFSRFVFYKIVNSRSRNEISDRWKDKHQRFRKTLFSELQKLDLFRNKLAHWTVGSDVKSGRYIYFLQPSVGTNHAPLSAEDIYSEAEKMRYFYYLFSSVILNLRGEDTAFWLPGVPLTDIFARPASYPPPSDHPLIPIWQGPTIPPQPSRA